MERYDAFISYRHSPLDIKVAAEIQKQLERFHIPTAIQKASGKKKISRIFRDKEELSLTGDLNETIQEALTHSEFLIVICSPAMKESFWVQKEIEYFLKTHSKRQILTVIAEGEPADVLPELLTYEEMELPDEKGELETVRVPVEPLSCDYRMPFRKARKEELPRLAAPIIGCSYDDLRRRQRQYRMRRLSAAFSAAALLLAFLSVYFAWSASQIRGNLNKALINHSEYLASESRSLLTGGDRLSAIMLALHALPQNDNDRPVVPSAINALSQSTYAYVSPGNEKISLDYLITPGGKVSDFRMDDSETCLVFRYDSYHIAVWDIAESRMRFSTQLSAYINQIDFSASDQLLVLTDSHLKCLSPADGSLIWEYSSESGQLFNRFCLAPEGQIALYCLDHLLLIEEETGTPSDLIELPEEYSDQAIKDVVFSPDGSHLALYFSRYSDQVLILDRAKRSFSSYTLTEGSFYQMRFGEDNTLYLAAAKDAFTYFVTDGDALYSKDSGALLKLDPSGKLLWQTEIDSFHSPLFSHLYFADYVSEGESTPALMFCYSNLCCMYDRNTGLELSRVEFLGSVIDAKQSDIGLRCLLDNGDYAICNSSAEVVRSTPCFISGNSSGLLGENIYILDESGKNILVYRHNIWDDSWQSCCEINGEYYDTCERGILLSSDAFRIALLDCTSREILWEANTEIESNRFSILGTGADGNTAVLWMYGKDLEENRRTAICVLDLNTGHQQYHYIEENPAEDEVALSGETVYFLKSEYDENFMTHYSLVGLDLNTGESHTLAISLEEYAPDSFSISPSKDMIFFWDRKGQCAVYQNETFTRIGEPVTEDYVSYSLLLTAVWSEDESLIAVTGKDGIELYSKELEHLALIPLSSGSPGAITFYEDRLLAVYSEKLCCYHTDGSFIAEIAIQGAATPFECSISPAGEGRLSLRVNDTLNLIDTSFWQSYATVERCIYYDPNLQQIFTVSYLDDRTVIGCYEEYSLQELIERGNAQLNGLEPTEELKNRYGLS